MVVAESEQTSGPVGPAGIGAIEIEFAAGARMQITGTVDALTRQMDVFGDPIASGVGVSCSQVRPAPAAQSATTWTFYFYRFRRFA